MWKQNFDGIQKATKKYVQYAMGVQRMYKPEGVTEDLPGLEPSLLLKKCPLRASSQ